MTESYRRARGVIDAGQEYREGAQKTGRATALTVELPALTPDVSEGYDMSTPQPSDVPEQRRKPIPKRVRFEVLRRDNYTCRYCKSTDGPLTIDHVTPTVLGGSDDPSNLVAACKDCNAGKSSSSPDAPLVAQVDEDALRWRAAMVQAAAEVLQDFAAGAEYCDPVARAWDLNNELYRRSKAWLPDNWTDQVEHWRSLGLPSAVVVEAIGISMRNKSVDLYDVWRYMSGVCWKRVRAMQERAAAIVGGA